MPLQEHRISSIQPLRLSASARAKALYGVLIRRGRDDLRVVRLNAVAGAPYFIYPAQRHRASARAKALYGALIPRGRDDLRVVRLNAVAGAPYFIYPALRLCASARAKAFYGALIPRGRDDLRVVRKLCSLRFQLQPQHRQFH